MGDRSVDGVEISGIIHAIVLGLGTGLALIVAIGAQNAFVLRQGLLGRHVAAVVAVCAVSDAALIAAGILGMGGLVTAAPAVVVALRYVGAAFLFCYGAMAARRAFRPQSLLPGEDDGDGRADGGLTAGTGPAGAGSAAPGSTALATKTRATGLAPALATILALTWLNPHVYLDTVVLLGSVANAQGEGLQWWFGAGAVLGSILWFCSLGFGARLLRGFFARPASWRILDGGIAVTMTALAAGLVLGN
ncbi:LysE/ArgO family amino acid transporter [Arthrobacter celericrescens]|uniref:LysE/ArgO family amino acid transporter n=1 Tax=Arthrobacter celericrescens TaxID=2320851 RepID=UPI001FE0A146|nr:LysE family transporter [Arthrobacter celericrescens]